MSVEPQPFIQSKVQFHSKIENWRWQIADARQIGPMLDISPELESRSDIDLIGYRACGPAVKIAHATYIRLPPFARERFDGAGITLPISGETPRNEFDNSQPRSAVNMTVAELKLQRYQQKQDQREAAAPLRRLKLPTIASNRRSGGPSRVQKPARAPSMKQLMPLQEVVKAETAPNFYAAHSTVPHLDSALAAEKGATFNYETVISISQKINSELTAQIGDMLGVPILTPASATPDYRNPNSYAARDARRAKALERLCLQEQGSIGSFLGCGKVDG